ncbi:MAG: DUF885 domain-containing protein [Saprospiraceae bacterium]|nr:DUF885 domain-containing protein [Saprospiraceae bacterium]
MKKTTYTALCCFLMFNALHSQSLPSPLSRIVTDFAAGYRALDVPEMDFDYKEYLSSIPSVAEIEKREAFFQQYQKQLGELDADRLSPAEKLTFGHLRYQTGLQLERCALEKKIKKSGSFAVPADGLSKAPEGKALYRFYIRYATGVDISPDEVYQYGLSEIKKIHGKMGDIRARAGFANDSAGWANYLNNSDFFITDRDSVRAGYERIKAQVLAHLGSLFEQTPAEVPDIDFMTWPDAGPYTPPGRYLSAQDNAYGKAVFQFNFYGNRHNRRAMDWMFIHEAIPGHHFHRSVRVRSPQDGLTGLWFPGGTVEGWATYVEYFGEEMGLYRDDWAWLGKWEWDLVRSVRIVISVGIHERGWSKAEALAFWKANIPNQDEIAEREVTRCTNWPAQVLTYKIGAKKIFELREAAEKREGARFDIRKFHTRFMAAGYVPLEVMGD